jgi:hypothetical protein
VYGITFFFLKGRFGHFYRTRWVVGDATTWKQSVWNFHAFIISSIGIQLSTCRQPVGRLMTMTAYVISMLALRWKQMNCNHAMSMRICRGSLLKRMSRSRFGRWKFWEQPYICTLGPHVMIPSPRFCLCVVYFPYVSVTCIGFLLGWSSCREADGLGFMLHVFCQKFWIPNKLHGYVHYQFLGFYIWKTFLSSIPCLQIAICVRSYFAHLIRTEGRDNV